MSERRWQYLWAAWVGYFAVVETLAIRSGDPKAPFCHVLRSTLATRHQHPVARQAGQVALGAGVVWLISHLYEQEEL